MDKRITRFKHCDPRFYPYLENVFKRLPAEVKENVLNNEAFQIVSHDDFHEMCMLSYQFDHPVEKLVYLNTKVLKEAEHRAICTIAHAIAYAVGEKDRALQERELEKLLVDWGFEQELEAVRYCRAIFESASYKIGYEWAKKQNRDYLIQHFGLYFDEWNERGLGRMSRERFQELYDQADISSILAHMPQIQKQKHIEPEKEKVSSAFTSDEAIIAGIMAAVKEMNFEDLYKADMCA